MNTRQQEGIHRIEVDRDAEGEVSAVRFVCDGTSEAPCHSFPDCDCETWTFELHGVRKGQVLAGTSVAKEDVPPAPGHEDVIHDNACWVDPWFNAALTDPADWIDAYVGEDEITETELRSGAIESIWEGDYMTWEYAS